MTALFCLSAHRPVGARSSAIEDERFELFPSVEARLNFDYAPSTLGWAGLDVTGTPERDDLRVDVLIGLPRDRAEWVECKGITFYDEDKIGHFVFRWAGVSRDGSVYDALTGRLSVEALRRLVAAPDASFDACGERVELPPETRQELRTFLRDFDAIATEPSPSAPTPRRELGDDHEFMPPAFSEAPTPA
ncbi:MAG: hypothetical protein AAF411_21815 [Myxococcota bacterium]